MLNPCDAAFADHLAGLLPPDTLRAPEPRHVEEPRGPWTGQAGALALRGALAVAGEFHRGSGIDPKRHRARRLPFGLAHENLVPAA
jgi:hypothetical protein